uniref:GRF-type domain-containing protein n=1 Tax=Chenopodium quinoa TaxID=63459 RepID=A0A803LJX4_CHEQI
MSRIGSGVSARSKRCNSSLLVSKSRAWTKDNRGRRFLACPDYDTDTGRRGSNYFRWDDQEDRSYNWQLD